MGIRCSHTASILAFEPSALGCEECLKSGSPWEHLRLCRTCGHVGCCDQSPNRHATAHFRESGHPAVQSLEPDEDWRWCYADQLYADGPSGPG
jgi:uncharacterized UBP type Zn finger protein